MRRLLYILIGLLCVGCSEMWRPSQVTPTNIPNNDSLQDIDHDAQTTSTEYKVPLSLILWATEETIK